LTEYLDPVSMRMEVIDDHIGKPRSR